VAELVEALELVAALELELAAPEVLAAALELLVVELLVVAAILPWISECRDSPDRVRRNSRRTASGSR
jgi:hypothetical protein